MREINHCNLVWLCNRLNISYEYDVLNYRILFKRKSPKNTSELLEVLFGDKSDQLVICRNRFMTLLENGWIFTILSSWAETGEIDLEWEIL